MLTERRGRTCRGRGRVWLPFVTLGSRKSAPKAAWSCHQHRPWMAYARLLASGMAYSWGRRRTGAAAPCRNLCRVEEHQCVLVLNSQGPFVRQLHGCLWNFSELARVMSNGLTAAYRSTSPSAPARSVPVAAYFSRLPVSPRVIAEGARVGGRGSQSLGCNQQQRQVTVGSRGLRLFDCPFVGCHAMLNARDVFRGNRMC